MKLLDCELTCTETCFSTEGGKRRAFVLSCLCQWVSKSGGRDKKNNSAHTSQYPCELTVNPGHSSAFRRLSGF